MSTRPQSNPGNELVGAEAKAAATVTDNPPRSVSYASARSLIRRNLTDLPATNAWTAEVYGGFFWFKVYKAISNGADVVLLVRLRGGYTLLLGPFADPLCPHL